MKNRYKYSHSSRKKFFRSVPATKIFTIKAYVKAGYSRYGLEQTFGLTEEQSKFFYLEFEPVKKVDYECILGSKKEPYYEGEHPIELPMYTIDDLQGEELEILKHMENGQNEGDLH
jgi:hypothetical protein